MIGSAFPQKIVRRAFCVLASFLLAGSVQAEQREPRQGRKAATVSAPFRVTRGCLMFWRGDESTRIFYALSQNL